MASKWSTVDHNPSESGRYLVTRTDITRKDETKRWIDFGYYSALSGRWFGNAKETVIAWKDAPAYFKGKIKTPKSESVEEVLNVYLTSEYEHDDFKSAD